jgi:hypothetical protein
MEINRKLCLQIFEWCKTKYGKSKFRRAYPKLYFRTKAKVCPDEGPLKGEYYFSLNHIYIYAELHYFEPDPILDVINTIIHEYKHFLQDMQKYDMYFHKYYRSYKNHPYEVTCNNFANKEQYECFYHIIKENKTRKGRQAA